MVSTRAHPCFTQAERADVDAGDNDERKKALGKDSHMRLMLKLLSFERTDEDDGVYFSVRL